MPDAVSALTAARLAAEMHLLAIGDVFVHPLVVLLADSLAYVSPNLPYRDGMSQL